eukprot:1175860-Rhodomonas_salina.1
MQRVLRFRRWPLALKPCFMQGPSREGAPCDKQPRRAYLRFGCRKMPAGAVAAAAAATLEAEGEAEQEATK